MKLRPHHLLDIIATYGHGQEFEPHPYGHAVHTVAEAVLANPELEVEFVVGADDICKPCRHLKQDGLCDDVVAALSPPSSKQEHNDQVDRRLLSYLDLREHAVMTARQFLQMVDKRLPGLEIICVHPGETNEHRLEGLVEGLRKLGIRGA